MADDVRGGVWEYQGGDWRSKKKTELKKKKDLASCGWKTCFIAGNPPASISKPAELSELFKATKIRKPICKLAGP